MEREHLTEQSHLGHITIAPEAIAQIVGHTAAECYGVVGMAGKGAQAAADPRHADAGDRVSRQRAMGSGSILHVVVEYGLNLAEVAATRPLTRRLRGRAADRPPVASVEVHIDDVRTTRVTRSRARPGARWRAALAALEANRRRIDDLNVYPVPDGDTGTNLTLTARAVVERSSGRRPPTAPALAQRDHARGAHGRPRQLGRDPLPDRARRGRGARRAG